MKDEPRKCSSCSNVEVIGRKFDRCFQCRFWDRVPRASAMQNDSCWEWTGDVNSNGYGRIGRLGKRELAHRACYEMVIGRIPDGIFVCHQCDNSLCVRPSHLFLGTVQQNNSDMWSKGRYKRGENDSGAKLNDSDVLRIKALWNQGSCTQKSMAETYGVSRALIWSIVSGRRWKHIQSIISSATEASPSESRTVNSSSAGLSGR